MICDYCKKGELVEGTLEGVSFMPQSQHRKMISSGVYGISVFVCLSCGRLSDFQLSLETLQKILKKQEK